ncbi:MAG: lipid-A-disaccharide synthase [Verrucomicrobiales bacterium]
MSKFYLVAGEISGDNRGAELMRSLGEKDPGAVFCGMGGQRMRATEGGAKIADWVEEAGVVGVWEVLRKYGYFRRQFHRVLGEIASEAPDAVILIDYPGFNLRLAKALRRKNPSLRIIYYISPQVWAWNRGRIPRMARMLDLMICIFPFEKELYQASGLETVFAGHPMVDELAPLVGSLPREDDLVGLFPGSRSKEVEKLFPLLLEAAAQIAKQRPGTRFIATAVSESVAGRMRVLLESLVGHEDINCEIVVGETHQVMARATCAAVASGTATLEAAFFGMPYCLVYEVAWPTYCIGKVLVRLEHLGIVNILAGREVVKEFIQHQATPGAVAGELNRLLGSGEARGELCLELEEAVACLGSGGAAAKAADAVLEAVRSAPEAEI